MLPEDKGNLGAFHTNLSVGDILKRARLKKLLSLEQVEIAIRVTVPHLQAIELGRFDLLPDGVYTLGFIRAYANHVDLDGDKIVELVKRQAGEKIAAKETPPPPAPILDDYSYPTGKIILVIFLMLCSVFWFKSLLEDSPYLEKDKILPVPQDLKLQTTLLTKPEPVPSEEQDNTSEQSDDSARSNQPNNQIVLKAIENVWLEIRDGQQKTIFSRVLNSGEEYWVPIDKTDLVMTLGNAGGLQINVGEKALPLLGKTGQVIRKVALDPEKLKEILKKNSKKAM